MTPNNAVGSFTELIGLLQHLFRVLPIPLIQQDGFQHDILMMTEMAKKWDPLNRSIEQETL